MNYKQIRDHKFRILFLQNLLREKAVSESDLDMVMVNYFDNLPYFDGDEDDNSYIRDENSSKKDIAIVGDIEIHIDEKDQIEDIKHKIKDIIKKFDDINNIIEKSLVNWESKRVGKAEMTIIILAVYEMYYDDSIDLKIAINEALELSKIYCDEKAVRFINGVLSTIYKQNEEKNV